MEEREYSTMYAVESRHWWFRGSRRVILSLFRRYRQQVLRSTPSDAHPLRLLDLGCGTGFTLDVFRSEPGVVPYGLDVDRSALSFCRQRALDQLVRGSISDVPFRDRSFDVVTALDVIEHVEDDRAALREMKRLLTPGGLAIITVPAFPWLWSEHDRALHHFRRYTRASLKTAMREAGLEPVFLSYYNFLLFPAVAVVRAAGKLFDTVRPRPAGQAPRSDVRLPPAPANTALRELFAAERHWLGKAGLPFGVSLIAVAKRRRSRGSRGDEPGQI